MQPYKPEEELFRVYDISWMNDEQFEDETIKLCDYKTGLMSLICALNTDLDDSPWFDAGFTEPLHLWGSPWVSFLDPTIKFLTNLCCSFRTHVFISTCSFIVWTRVPISYGPWNLSGKEFIGEKTCGYFAEFRWMKLVWTLKFLVINVVKSPTDS